MQRRIGLAQALINNPELILLDEPTSGLDPIGTAEIKNLIRELREQGKTIVLSGHLLADMQDICDRIAILHRGELKELGRVSDLLTVQDVTQIKARNLSPGGAGGGPRRDPPPRRRGRRRSTTRRPRWRSCSSGSCTRATCTRAVARWPTTARPVRPPPAAGRAGRPGQALSRSDPRSHAGRLTSFGLSRGARPVRRRRGARPSPRRPTPARPAMSSSPAGGRTRRPGIDRRVPDDRTHTDSPVRAPSDVRHPPDIAPARGRRSTRRRRAGPAARAGVGPGRRRGHQGRPPRRRQTGAAASRRPRPAPRASPRGGPHAGPAPDRAPDWRSPWPGSISPATRPSPADGPAGRRRSPGSRRSA